MASFRTSKIWISVAFFIVSISSNAQYKEDLNDLLKHLGDKKANGLTLENFRFNELSPLGIKAQKLRAKSYAGKTKTQSEKGLWIKIDDKEFLYKHMKTYSFTELKCDYQELKFNEYETAYAKDLRRTVSALNSLYEQSAYARNIIETLQNSQNKFTIAIVPCIYSYMLVPILDGRLGVLNNNAYAFQVLDKDTLVVDYAPFDQIGSGAEIRWTPSLKKIRLAHELSHAYDANFGLLDDRLAYANGRVVSTREIRALYHENMIRKDLKKKLRIELPYGSALVMDGEPYTFPLPVSARY
ncbi:MAG: hypothetical protein ABJG47_15385 [Ekhidna sp.]